MPSPKPTLTQEEIDSLRRALAEQSAQARQSPTYREMSKRLAVQMAEERRPGRPRYRRDLIR